jgi:hypothetical protein
LVNQSSSFQEREKYLSETKRTMLKFGMSFPQSDELGAFSFSQGQAIYSQVLLKKSIVVI